MTPPTPSQSPVHLHDHGHAHPHGAPHHHAPQAGSRLATARSVLAWPAWLRVAAVVPLLCVLWLAVWWANEGVSPW